MKKKNISLTAIKKNLCRIYMSPYIRKRDKGICISCGNKRPYKEQNAGHFVHNKMDFNEKNINCQCVHCNKWLKGNLGWYAVNLDLKWGKDTAQKLLKKGKSIVAEKYTLSELNRLIKKYKTKLEKL